MARAPKPVKYLWLIFCPRAGVVMQWVYGTKEAAELFAKDHRRQWHATPTDCGARVVKFVREDAARAAAEKEKG
jgi:hypothetical protein